MYIVFDFDGTIHDTSALFMPALGDTVKWLGDAAPDVVVERVPGVAEVGWRLGSDARGLWRTIAPDIDDETADACVEHMRGRILERARAGEAKLYPGAAEMLDALTGEGHVLALLSNCRTAYLETFRKVLGLERWFTHLWCGEDFGWVPKSEIFARVQGELGDEAAGGLSEGGCIVVGDRATDIDIAVAGGFRSVGCGYGYGADGELGNADVIAWEPLKLEAAIMQCMR